MKIGFGNGANRRRSHLPTRALGVALAVGSCVGLGACSSSSAGDQTVNWSGSAARTSDGWAEYTAPDGGGRLPLATVENPVASAAGLALEGRIRARDVVGQGYVEMWLTFPDGSRYFSRTLAATGPNSGVTGTFGSRRLLVPFSLVGTTLRPSRLDLTLVLVGSGRVAFGPATVVPDPAGKVGVDSWWSDSTGGWIGAVVGSLTGLSCAALVVAATKRRVPRRAGTVLLGVAVVGAGSVVLGVVAAAIDQPYAVWYPPLLVGVTWMLVGLLGWKWLRRRTSESELRRMAALDTA